MAGRHGRAVSSRFARVRVRVAHRDYWLTEPRTEEWLLIEWLEGENEPTKYWLSTLPDDITFRRLVDTTKLRWRIGVSSEGPAVMSVKVRPEPKDSGFEAREAPWRESKTAEPSDNMLERSMREPRLIGSEQMRRRAPPGSCSEDVDECTAGGVTDTDDEAVLVRAWVGIGDKQRRWWRRRPSAQRPFR